MKIDFGKIRSGLSWGNIRRVALSFIFKQSGWFLFFLIVGLSAYGGYLWYANIYKSQWSESTKQEYIKSKNKDVTFNKAKFDQVVKEAEDRKNNYGKSMDDLADVFKVKSN